MKRPDVDPYLLTTVLSNPQFARGLGTRDWERLIWQARNAELIGQLRFVLHDAEVLAEIPNAARRHLEVAWEISIKHSEAVQWELRSLQDTLGSLGVQVVLLKGAAYSAQSNRAAIGRIFNDIDILVPKTALQVVETNLIRAGWLPSHANVYDERYYREWMHELPPMEHKNRSTVLDVHHTILAPTSGIRPDPKAFFAGSLPIPGRWSFFRVLAPEDMVMHSACHLFFGEFHKGLRDLFDLHTLLSDFSSDAQFWGRLLARSESMGLTLPVLDALQQSRRLFGTDIAIEVLRDFERRSRTSWPQWTRTWLFDQVLRPNHSSAVGATTRFAQRMAFARSHWLRMPLPLLIYHLSHKLFSAD
jgi:hypothetical protein